MRVVAINGSPRMDKGNTAMILNPFLEGMRGAGAEVELFYAKKLKVRPCSGSFACWRGPAAKCGIDDDMTGLLARLRNADTWVFGVPVYVPMPGEMQNILNRTMPLLDAKIVVVGGRMQPHVREVVQVKRMVLVSSSSYWELDNFNEVIASLKRISDVFLTEFVGPILRPHADTLKAMLKDGSGGQDVVNAAREAGEQLVKKGSISKKSLLAIQRPLLTFEEFIGDFEVVR